MFLFHILAVRFQIRRVRFQILGVRIVPGRPWRQLGDLVFFLPSEIESWPSWTCQCPGETLMALLSCQVPVQPIGVSVLPPPGTASTADTIVRFGKVVEPGNDALPQFWERLFAANEAALTSAPFLAGGLGYAIIHGLKR